MAYSDYGGFAYRNGKRVDERSDYTITPDGGGFGTPGAYPGFAAIAAGATGEQAKEIASYPHYHVVLGDGPIFIGLYKQSHVAIHRGAEELDLVAHAEPQLTDEQVKDYGSERYVNKDAFLEAGKPATFLIDGHRLEVRWTEEDNYYQYARLTQPDGTVWTGWSGYGVGAGLDDGSYGFSSEERDERLAELFPNAPHV